MQAGNYKDRDTRLHQPVVVAGPAGRTGLREARVRIIAWISWLTGRGQQSDSYYTRTYLSSVTRYLPELASLSSFARILKACHLLWLETYPPM